MYPSERIFLANEEQPNLVPSPVLFKNHSKRQLCNYSSSAGSGISQPSEEDTKSPMKKWGSFAHQIERNHRVSNLSFYVQPDTSSRHLWSRVGQSGRKAPTSLFSPNTLPSQAESSCKDSQKALPCLHARKMEVSPQSFSDELAEEQTLLESLKNNLMVDGFYRKWVILDSKNYLVWRKNLGATDGSPEEPLSADIEQFLELIERIGSDEKEETQRESFRELLSEDKESSLKCQQLLSCLISPKDPSLQVDLERSKKALDTFRDLVLNDLAFCLFDKNACHIVKKLVDLDESFASQLERYSVTRISELASRGCSCKVLQSLSERSQTICGLVVDQIKKGSIPVSSMNRVYLAISVMKHIEKKSLISFFLETFQNEGHAVFNSNSMKMMMIFFSENCAKEDADRLYRFLLHMKGLEELFEDKMTSQILINLVIKGADKVLSDIKNFMTQRPLDFLDRPGAGFFLLKMNVDSNPLLIEKILKVLASKKIIHQLFKASNGTTYSRDYCETCQEFSPLESNSKQDSSRLFFIFCLLKMRADHEIYHSRFVNNNVNALKRGFFNVHK